MTSTKYTSRNGVSPELGLLSTRLTNSPSDDRVVSISGALDKLVSFKMELRSSEDGLLSGKCASREVARTQNFVKFA